MQPPLPEVGVREKAAYDITGEGQPLVFVHGLGGTSAIWHDVRSALAGQFTTLAYDLRGSGSSAPASTRRFTVELWANDLRALLTESKLGAPIIVGHSLGASIALKYALTWPTTVAGLVLMGADAHIAHLGDRMKIAAERIRHDGLDVWVSAYWSKNPPFSRHSQIRLPGIFDRYKTMLLNNNPENYIETCMAIANAEDLTDELHQIQAPALVIAGLEDDRTSAAASRTLATKLPNARLVELPEVGHTMALEAPLDVAHRIDDFATSVFSNLVSGSLSA